MLQDRALEVADEVRQALWERRPVVALESTLIAHGMPYPRNAETGRRLEEEIRAGGAVPATIAVLDGRLRVGLDEKSLEDLGQRGPSIRKLSRRDLPIAVARGEDGATTVAATAAIAAMVGIRVFVTGGIGGVHRGAAETFDVSADLPELARSNLVVISAGAKAILDLAATREVLETWGVPVLGWKTDRFPAFFYRDSGLEVDQRVESVTEVAAIARAKWDLDLDGAVLLANPIAEEFALDRQEIEKAIDEALQEAERQGLAGKELTPFLLARVEKLTGGRSLDANVELVLSNARLGAALARELV